MTTGFFLDDFYQEIDNPEGKGTVVGNAGYFGKKIGRKKIGTDSKGNPIYEPVYNNLGQKHANENGRLFGFSAAFKLGTKAGTDNWTALIGIKDKFANKSDKEKAKLILDTVLEYKSFQRTLHVPKPLYLCSRMRVAEASPIQKRIKKQRQFYVISKLEKVMPATMNKLETCNQNGM